MERRGEWGRECEHTKENITHCPGFKIFVRCYFSTDQIRNWSGFWMVLVLATWPYFVRWFNAERKKGEGEGEGALQKYW